MVNALLELGIGWFLTYKAVRVIGAKRRLAMVIKIIGIILMISGVVSLTHLILRS